MGEAKLKRHQIRQKQRELKQQRKEQGEQYPPKRTLPNRKSDLKTVEQEREKIQTTTEEKLKVYQQLLPGLVKKLSRIPDPRNPNKVKHQMTVMMLYGILMFVFQITSRRKANQELTTPQLMANLQVFFPTLTDMPHQDTLCRLLQEIDVDQVEELYVDLLRKLIYKKTFQRLLLNKRYLVAIDGTQKYVMDECWDERYLHRQIKKKEGPPKTQYYAYVLEAVLVLTNGMVLPLVSEFLENDEEIQAIDNEEKRKQDCERKAFHRLAKRLKQQFPKLPLTLLMDGLYANGPVMEVCRSHRWQFMIVLKEGALRNVWREFQGRLKLDKKQEQSHEQTWQGRKQVYRWANDIEHTYGPNEKKSQTIHVVRCDESWQEVDQDAQVITKTGKHVWISSEPIHNKNVHDRCNLAARKRWLHENNILKEKQQGYQYEHIFSHDWNAMRGYHYLMHIARMMNEMALHSFWLVSHRQEVGVQGFLQKFFKAMSANSLDAQRLQRLVEKPHQLRLVWDGDWETHKQAAS
jgi:hypothetical protein